MRKKKGTNEELRHAILEAELGEELALVTGGCCCCCCCDDGGGDAPDSGGGEMCGGTCVISCTQGGSAGTMV